MSTDENSTAAARKRAAEAAAADPWRPIDTVPPELKDGGPVWVRRVYRGEVVAEGEAVWGVLHADAPMREPTSPIDLQTYGHTPEEHAKYVDAERWLKPGRLYPFPVPTHWKP